MRYKKNVVNSFLLASLELDNLEAFKIYTVADVLKVYLRELPSPLLGYDFYAKVINDLYQIVCPFSRLRFPNLSKVDTEPKEWLEQLKAMVQGLPIISYALLKYLARHLWHVSQKSEENLMGVSNLAIVFGKSLFLHPQKQQKFYLV